MKGWFKYENKNKTSGFYVKPVAGGYSTGRVQTSQPG